MEVLGGAASVRSDIGPPRLSLVLGGAYSSEVADDTEAVRRSLQETLLFLRGQHARLKASRAGAFYATVVGAWIRFLESALERLP